MHEVPRLWRDARLDEVGEELGDPVDPFGLEHRVAATPEDAVWGEDRG